MPRTLFLGFAMLLMTSMASAQNPYRTIKDLKYDWLVLSQDGTQLEPHLDQSQVTSIFFELSPLKFQGFFLRIEIPSSHYIFLNRKLIGKSDNSGEIWYDIDSLSRMIEREKLEFSIFSKELNPDRLETTIISLSQGGSSYGTLGMSHESRSISKLSDQFVILSLCIFGFVVILRNSNNRLFKEYLDFYHLFAPRQRFELITSYSLFSFENLGFLLLYAVLMGASFVNLLFFSGEIEQVPYWAGDISPLVWGMVFMVLFALVMILKMPFLGIITSLFRVSRISQLHFFTYFRISLAYAFLIFVFSLGNTIYNGHWLSDFNSFFIGLLVILLIIRLSVVWIVLNSELNFQKLHIISYLCSTEIIPLVFFLKFLIK